MGSNKGNMISTKREKKGEADKTQTKTKLTLMSQDKHSSYP